MSSNNVILLLGSNINFPEKNIDTAIELISSRLGSIIAMSSKLMTDPVEFDSKNIFCNIAVLIKTQFSPVQLLKNIKEIEREMGREEDSFTKGGYEDRIIDIDIVEFGSIRFHSQKLMIPHLKHLNDRDFSQELLTQLNTNIEKK
ncbi:2-amino-4-hydroxy-6-hydroxymethyldihydropteridine diphosphokinase [Elizabethkingia anophelis]|uniref:2-amino-4-hydroxy-6- hydroxymethyldihydropteridine diphosphokinase n=1 Tax=Elizabethkingia anophelis TaxID=1117645 RepID=UPI0004E40E35|nr:2-amino-4-hydroxy-6-hydroxymethyldihydropteridine diphosphokinase [Elizabethkingia anophelis]KFC33273.1 2-amino-4-hydroxy-6-hydroxymethyldihydropteridine pyrophosphokinase [Elizabethkingia anophelis]MCL1034435.1 2-amino-4-hydroxy-6-hydroxymethyldihydropteridine diphosphokinase [Elizabethkingia anophelis]MCT3786835.1 2-amino-4-hydroxy-6-hydroxymethyldihydropteridine diphosphokinase [Elizabethkingia anophelis]MDV3500976.1 2-amino-4-hydroxy-6-hydroxymethyldihydropteridine diphosphokinase [Eliza